MVRKWWVKENGDRDCCPPRRVIMAYRTSSHLSTQCSTRFLCPSVSMSICLSPCLAPILSAGHLFTCLMRLGFKNSSYWHHLWRKDNFLWSEQQWLSVMSCNLSSTIHCNNLLCLGFVQYSIVRARVLVRDWSIICGFIIVIIHLITH